MAAPAFRALSPAAIAVGMGWGLLILAFDRSLMVGMTSSPSVRRNLLMAAPRVVLALIMGSVISTPLTLQIFHKETAAEIATLCQCPQRGIRILADNLTILGFLTKEEESYALTPSSAVFLVQSSITAAALSAPGCRMFGARPTMRGRTCGCSSSIHCVSSARHGYPNVLMVEAMQRSWSR